jgi:hypothetical protein
MNKNKYELKVLVEKGLGITIEKKENNFVFFFLAG